MADPTENQLVTAEEQEDNYVQPVKPKATSEQIENAESTQKARDKEDI